MDNLNKNDLDRMIEEDMTKYIIHPQDVGMADNDLKIRLKCCKEIDEADRILEEYLGMTNEEHKIRFLMDNFDVKVVHREDKDIHTDYMAMLHAVMHH